MLGASGSVDQAPRAKSTPVRLFQHALEHEDALWPQVRVSRKSRPRRESYQADIGARRSFPAGDVHKLDTIAQRLPGPVTPKAGEHPLHRLRAEVEEVAEAGDERGEGRSCRAADHPATEALGGPDGRNLSGQRRKHGIPQLPSEPPVDQSGAEPSGHASPSPSAPRSCRSAAAVRDFTVPTGIPRRSAMLDELRPSK